MHDETPQWFLAQGRETFGPLPLEGLIGLVRTGQLSPSDLLLRQGDQRWFAAGELPGLFAETTAESRPPGALAEALEIDGGPKKAPEIPPALSCSVDGPQTLAGEATHVEGRPGPSDRAPVCQGYEILEELGRGGMGIVYKARQLKLNRIVALKMILSGRYAGPAERQRFQTEAEAIARLHHPNIVQIYEVSEHEALPYFSLEFVEGGSLAHWLKGVPLQARASAVLVEALARAMQAAHQAGVIHRDLKPHNVLLARPGNLPTPENPQHEPKPDAPVDDRIPKITDFGLARKLDEEAQTRSGLVVGTPSYMAPEQAAGRSRDIGPAVDIYALGAILYECLTGRPPFRGATVMETLDLVRYTEPVPPSQLTPRTPRDLEVICLKCLQKEPSKRYATALELAEDLRRFRNGEPVRARPVGQLGRAWRWSKRNPALATLGLLLAISLSVGFAGVELNRREAVEERLRAERHAQQAQSEKEEANRLRELAETREAEKAQFLYASFMSQVPEAWQRGDLQAVQRYLKAFEPKPGSKGSPGFEWDFYWKLLHGSRLALLGHFDVTGLAFSPDGTRLASCGQDRTVRMWDTRTGQELWKHHGRTAFFNVAFSPDGKTVVVRFTDAFLLLDARTGTISGRVLADGRAAFVPDGSALIVGQNESFHFYDPTGKRKRLTVADAHKGGFAALALSANSRWLYTSGGDGVVRLWHNDGTLKPGSVREKASTPRGSRGAVNYLVPIVCTPDASRMVCLARDNVIEVWAADLDKATLTLDKSLAPRRGAVAALAITPDGKSLIVAGGDGALRLFDIAQGQERKLIGSHSLRLQALALSSDGKQLASGGKDGVVRVWDMPEPSRVARAESVNALAYSPTADLLVSAGEDGTVRLWNAQTGAVLGRLQERGSAARALAFTPDGRELGVGYEDGAVVWWDVKNRTARGNLEARGAVTCLAVSTDGNRLAVGTELGFLATYDLRQHKRLRMEAVHVKRVSAVVFSTEGRQLWTTSWDHTVQQHDWETNARSTVFRSPSPVKCLTVVSTTKAAIGTSSYSWLIDLQQRTAERLGTYGYGTAAILRTVDGKAMYWVGDYGSAGSLDSFPVDAPPDTRQKKEALFPSSLLAGAIAPDGKQLAVAGKEGVLSLWDCTQKKVVSRWPGHAQAVTALACSPDGCTLACGRADFAVVLNDVATQRERAVLTGLAGSVSAVQFSPDGQIVAAASLDGTVRVWNVATGTATGFADPLRIPIHTLLFTPDGRTIFSGGGTANSIAGRLLRWDVQTEKLHPVSRESFPHRNAIRDMALADGGKVLVSVTDSDFGTPGELKLWDPVQGRELAALYPDSFGLQAIAVAPDGRTLATGGISRTVRIWDISNPSQPIQKFVFRGHQSRIRALAFTPDGRTLVATGDDGTLRFWQPQLGLPLGVVPLDGRAGCLTFHPKENTLYVGHDDGTIRSHRTTTLGEREAVSRMTDHPVPPLDLLAETARIQIAAQRELATQQRIAGATTAAAHTLRQTDRLFENWLRRQPEESLILQERGEVLLELMGLIAAQQPTQALDYGRTAEAIARRILGNAPENRDAHDLLVQSLHRQAEQLKRSGQEAQATVVFATARKALADFFAHEGVSQRTVKAFLFQLEFTPLDSLSPEDRKRTADRCSAVLSGLMTSWRRWNRAELFQYQRVELLYQLQKLQSDRPEDRLKTLRELAAVARLQVSVAPSDLWLREDLARINCLLGEAEEPVQPAVARQFYREALAGFESLRLAQHDSAKPSFSAALVRERLARLALAEGKHGEAKGLIAEAIRDLDTAQQLEPARGTQAVPTWRVLAGLLTTCAEQVKRDPELSATKRKEQSEQCVRAALDLLEKAVKHGYKDVAELEKAMDLKPLRRHPEFKKLLDAARSKS